jgi:hypothetical protein
VENKQIPGQLLRVYHAKNGETFAFIVNSVEAPGHAPNGAIKSIEHVPLKTAIAANKLLAHLTKLVRAMGLIEAGPNVPESVYQTWSAAEDYLRKLK